MYPLVTGLILGIALGVFFPISARRRDPRLGRFHDVYTCVIQGAINGA